MPGDLLADELRKRRLSKDVTQEDVAIAVGVKRATVTQWESGRFRPSPQKIADLDAYLGAEGALIALGATPVSAQAPVAGPPETPGATVADVFTGVGDRLVAELIPDPDESDGLGWPHNLGARATRPSPWSTAMGVRTLLLLDRVDVDLAALAATLGARQESDGWSNRRREVPRPDVTAVVLAALSRIGPGGADLDAAWRFLETAIRPPDSTSPFVLSTVLQVVAQLRPESAMTRRLVKGLLDARVPFEDVHAWPANPTPGALRVEPSVAHTARAVVALRAAEPAVDGGDLTEAVEQGVAWLATPERSYDGITEIQRVDEDRRELDVPVDHFTSAHVIQALAGTGHGRGGRLGDALAVLWDSYIPTENLWAWKQDGRLTMWMNFDAVSALRTAVLAGFPSPHSPGDRRDHTSGPSASADGR